ncbi:hypothetical protein [Paenibacillus sp. V4I5]|uniref:hypothetical protein n=1 Tax=Paenibacillus sp. V4I5 TaxID=3042306 RepID=UPI00279167AE|nr:hypothetical protein [Paenibacillus sp. V4I5]MDQ0913858.1 hypothetical protein [Paenibacillus sp. V4I5]
MFTQISKDRVDIHNSLNQEEVQSLAADNSLKVVQFSNEVDPATFRLLNDLLFSVRNDICLRAYGFYSSTCDLSFVSSLTNLKRFSADCLMDAKGMHNLVHLRNLKELEIGIYKLENFDFLNGVPDTLERLVLGATKSKKPDLVPLSRFTMLRKIYIEGQHKNIDVLSGLTNLEDVTLRSITTPDLNYLVPLKKMWSLDIKLGGINNFSAIEGLTNIKYLELWQIRGLSDVGFISTLNGLQNLFLQSLPNIEQLPSFDNLKNLRNISLENMKGLKDVSNLESAPALEEFIHLFANNMQPEDYIDVLKKTSLKRISCVFGSDKKNNRFDEIKKEFNKVSSEWSKFIYK